MFIAAERWLLSETCCLWNISGEYFFIFLKVVFAFLWKIGFVYTCKRYLRFRVLQWLVRSDVRPCFLGLWKGNERCGLEGKKAKGREAWLQTVIMEAFAGEYFELVYRR